LPDDYDALPECVKVLYTPQEYAWMSDEQKARLIQDSTEPETD
jgi:hypothetical protein